MFDRPALKYAVTQSKTGEVLNFRYRGVELSRDASLAKRVVPLLDGTRALNVISKDSGVEKRVVEDLVNQLGNASMLFDGTVIASVPTVVTGEHAFWILEQDLCAYKFYGREYFGKFDLERRIAAGEVPRGVVVGYLIELG